MLGEIQSTGNQCILSACLREGPVVTGVVSMIPHRFAIPKNWCSSSLLVGAEMEWMSTTFSRSGQTPCVVYSSRKRGKVPVLMRHLSLLNAKPCSSTTAIRFNTGSRGPPRSATYCRIRLSGTARDLGSESKAELLRTVEEFRKQVRKGHKSVMQAEKEHLAVNPLRLWQM